ncbi:MAG: hypothetical protein AVDCRST_MAG86-2998 [uncultured Truepera sp.]|uniref:Uncharacterized protein n=1 Tax=uncultured Truepera sp. TaxID=543023 RepID=A0A6J4VPP6_9DEIN|nr:MAG: hypothetical protein AVDCRST_MAG86-2998 [uncultured Truepera sp.]
MIKVMVSCPPAQGLLKCYGLTFGGPRRDDETEPRTNIAVKTVVKRTL